MTLTDNQKRALVKRIADIYEKVGVAGLALGLFQYNFQGALIGKSTHLNNTVLFVFHLDLANRSHYILYP